MAVLNRLLILLFLAAWSGLSFGQDVTTFLNNLESLPVKERQAAVDRFIRSCKSFPVTGPDTVACFIYQGDGSKVVLAGDATNWAPGPAFKKAEGTDLWYCLQPYERDARLDYKFVINGETWILDPMNPNSCAGGFGSNSELRMPGWQAPEPVFTGKPLVGKRIDTTFRSRATGQSYPVTLWLPPGYNRNEGPYPVVLFHDGPDYFQFANASQTLDGLVAAKKIVPVIAVFVAPSDRQPEYAGNRIDDFTKFITGELMPALDSGYATSREPSKRAMFGVSDGGNIVLYIGLKHPEQFGKIAAQSSDVIQEISKGFSGGKKSATEFYLDIGTYDIPQLVPMVRGLRDILKSKGYRYTYHEWHEGHSWCNWRNHLHEPLVQFFPAAEGAGKH